MPGRLPSVTTQGPTATFARHALWHSMSKTHGGNGEGMLGAPANSDVRRCLVPRMRSRTQQMPSVKGSPVYRTEAGETLATAVAYIADTKLGPGPWGATNYSRRAVGPNNTPSLPYERTRAITE